MEQLIALPPTLIAGIAVVLALACLLVMQHRHARLNHALSLQLQQLQAGMESTTRHLVGKIDDNERVIEQLDIEVSRLLARVRELKQHQSSVDARRRDTQRYGDALRLARQGTSMDLLMDTCGLNKGEADLVMQLNRKKRRAPAAPVAAPAVRASQSTQAKALASALAAGGSGVPPR